MIDSKILASERSTLVPFFNCSKIADGSKNRGEGEGKKTKGNVLTISASSMLKEHDKYRNSKKKNGSPIDSIMLSILMLKIMYSFI